MVQYKSITCVTCKCYIEIETSYIDGNSLREWAESKGWVRETLIRFGMEQAYWLCPDCSTEEGG